MNNIFGGFQAQPGMMFPNQFQQYSDEQILDELKSMGAYGDHNPTSMMLLGELYQRAQHAFAKTFIPSEEVHGDAYLYTSVYKDGFMTHYFVSDREAKLKIEEIFEGTQLPSEGASDQFLSERFRLLLELGDVFTAVKVNEYGAMVNRPERRGYGALISGKGFGTSSQHSSKSLPLAVVEIAFGSLMSMDPSKFIYELLAAIRPGFPSPDKLAEVEDYLNSSNVVKDYLDAVKKNHLTPSGIGNTGSTIQFLFFPGGENVPVKILGGLSEKWDEGFINQKLYPSLFLNRPNPYANNYTGPGVFGGFGPGPRF